MIEFLNSPSIMPVIDNLIAVGVIILQVIVMIYLVALIMRRGGSSNALIKFFEDNGLLITFLVVLGSTIGSLYYSEIRDFAPCILCWYQRVVMYPQVLILGMGLWRKDHGIRPYILALSYLGLLISVYQLLIPYLGDNFAPCSASAVSCSIIYVNYFGFITIPVMALTSWLLIILSTSFTKSHQ